MEKRTTKYRKAVASERKLAVVNGLELKPYEVNIVRITKDGRKRVVTVETVERFEATSVSRAHAIADLLPLPDAECKRRLFPSVDMADGESIMNFAKYIVRQYENWERRNDYAIMNLLDRTPEQRENMVQTAILGMYEGHVKANGNSVGFHLWDGGMRSVSNEQLKMRRHGEVEFDQNAKLTGTIQEVERKEHQTCPVMSELVGRAYRSGCLSREQQKILVLTKVGGMSAVDVADMLGINRRTVYTMVARAERNMLKWMLENDEHDAIGVYGLSVYDIETILAELEKKTTRRNGKKKK